MGRSPSLLMKWSKPMWTPDPSIIITAEMKAAEAQTATVDAFRAAIQAHVDQTARFRDYHDAVTLASYDTASQPREDWKADASAFVVWRTEVWTHAYAELDKVLDGLREQPTVQDFLDELPEMV